MDALRRTEAAERSRLLRVRSYDVELDMTRGAEVFGSVSRISFDCTEPGAATFLDRYLDALPEIWRTRGSDTAWAITTSMFPALLVSPATVERVSQALEADLDEALRRLLVEGRSELERALRTREVDRVAQPSQATVTSSA